MAKLSVTPTTVLTRLQRLEARLIKPTAGPPPVLLAQPEPDAPADVHESHRQALEDAEAAGSMVILLVPLRPALRPAWRPSTSRAGA